MSYLCHIYENIGSLNYLGEDVIPNVST